MEVLRFDCFNFGTSVLISTKDISIPWKRLKSRVQDDVETYCNYSCTHDGLLSLYNPQTDLIEKFDLTINSSKPLWPVVYETNKYSITIQFTSIEAPPKIIHANKQISEQFNCISTGKDAWLLSGSIDFLNEPGAFELSFSFNPIGENEQRVSLSFLVASPKLDIKKDGEKLLNDIHREYNNLVFKYLTKTFQHFQRGGKNENKLIWLSIFKDIVKDYLKAVRFVINRPHIHEQKEILYSHADKIKYWSNQMFERYGEIRIEGKLDYYRFRHDIDDSTINTRENQFVKYTLKTIGKKLFTIIHELKEQYGEEISQEELNDLNDNYVELQKLLGNRLFRSVGEFMGFRQESMVMQKRTGYSQVYRYWLMLQSGIQLYKGDTSIGVKQIWELYELWCFLRMKQIILELLEIDPSKQDDLQYIIEEKSSMLNPFSDSSLEHKVHFINKKNREKIDLLYQHTYSRFSNDDTHTLTTEQRPDIVLNIHKGDGQLLTYLYDAKYRVLDDNCKTDQVDLKDSILEIADYPTPDSINQMHRYRDAIYYGNENYRNQSKEIIGGYILFPGRGNDEKYRERFFFKSIEKVNIGAFPLLPNSTNNLLKEHLEQVLINRTSHEQIMGSIPQRGLKYVQDYKEDVVLIGYYETEEIKNLILKNKLYFVRAGFAKGSLRLSYGFESAKYVLLHKGKSKSLFKLSDKGARLVSGSDLNNLGFATSRDYYLCFDLDSSDEVFEIDISNVKLNAVGNAIAEPRLITLKEMLLS